MATSRISASVSSDDISGLRFHARRSIMGKRPCVWEDAQTSLWMARDPLIDRGHKAPHHLQPKLQIGGEPPDGCAGQRPDLLVNVMLQLLQDLLAARSRGQRWHETNPLQL